MPVAWRNNKYIVFSYFVAAIVKIMIALSIQDEIQLVEVVYMHSSLVIFLIEGPGEYRGGLIEKIIAVPMHYFGIR